LGMELVRVKVGLAELVEVEMGLAELVLPEG
jgi:hypothetical protein